MYNNSNLGKGLTDHGILVFYDFFCCLLKHFRISLAILHVLVHAQVITKNQLKQTKDSTKTLLFENGTWWKAEEYKYQLQGSVICDRL